MEGRASPCKEVKTKDTPEKQEEEEALGYLQQIAYLGLVAHFIRARALFQAPARSPSFSVKLTLPPGVALLYVFSRLPLSSPGQLFCSEPPPSQLDS
jgi:hypothetical protein